MNILLVEDDEDKREEIANYLRSTFNASLYEVRSFQSGLKAIKELSFDLIILDMTIPTYDRNPQENGGRTQAFGGKMLLFEMQRRKIKTRSIVVTQFDIFGKGDEEMNLTDLNLDLANTFGDVYYGAIQYNNRYDNWKALLFSRINKMGLK